MRQLAPALPTPRDQPTLSIFSKTPPRSNNFKVCGIGAVATNTSALISSEGLVGVGFVVAVHCGTNTGLPRTLDSRSEVSRRSICNRACVRKERWLIRSQGVGRFAWGGMVKSGIGSPE